MMIKTLKDRISLVYFFLVLLIAIIGATAVFNLFRLTNSINDLMTANYKSIKAVNNMTEYLEKQDMAIFLYIRVDYRQGINSFIDNQNSFQRFFDIENNNITEHGEQKLVNQLNRNYTDYLKLFTRLQEIKNHKGVESAFNFYNTSIRPKFDRIKNILNSLSNLNEKAMFQSKNSATVHAQRSMYVIMVISMIAVIGGFAASRFFVNRFLQPIDKLTETVKRVKAGDLNQQALIVYQDEIGELANEFNSMTKRLLQYEQSTIGKLMAEKNKSLAIVKSISDPLIVLDQDFRISLMNDAGEEFFTINEEKALNKHFLEIIRNEELFEHISSVFETKDDETKQKIVVIRSREKDFYFNVIVKVVKDAEATIHSMVVLFQNITQIKQLEKVKTDFIATVSHEFKTPLTSIMMGLSLLQEEKIGPLTEKQNMTIKTIQEEGETLATLVNDLLEISKIESGKPVFKIKPCSIAGIIESSVKKFLEAAESKEINLNYEAEDDLPKVSADAEKIIWVVNNLIGNALKYTNAGDEITVTAFVKQDKMCVAVKDTGVGIPPEYHDKLFDKFVQVKGYDLEVRGTGLGLVIAKEIIEAHGGEIWCESKLDVGSTFTFTLPLHRGDAE